MRNARAVRPRVIPSSNPESFEREHAQSQLRVLQPMPLLFVTEGVRVSFDAHYAGFLKYCECIIPGR